MQILISLVTISCYAGVYHRWEHFRALALAYRLDLSLFTDHFLKHLPHELRHLIGSKNTACGEVPSSSADEAHETCVWVDAHVDGVELFENSPKKNVRFFRM
jgi:hypothetical protein